MDDSMGGMGRYMVDIRNSWRLIVLMCLMSVVITLVYLALLRWITKPILYISLFAIFLFGTLTAVWLYRQSTMYP